MAIKEKIQNYKEEQKRQAMIAMFAERPRIRHAREQKRLASLSVEEYRKEQEAKYLKHVAEQLHGMEGRLVLVTNFDGRDHVARKAADAIKGSGVDFSKPVNFSVHTTEYMEKKRGFGPYEESADSLAAHLESLGVEVDDSKWRPETIADGGHVARVIREAAFWSKDGEDEDGLDHVHVAVLSALNVRELDVHYDEAFDGGVYLYKGTAEDGRPEWQKLGATGMEERIKKTKPKQEG